MTDHREALDPFHGLADEGLREAIEAEHARVCACPFDGSDPDCHLSLSIGWLTRHDGPSLDEGHAQAFFARGFEEGRASLDEGLLARALAGIGVIDNGTWVSFTEKDALAIAAEYRRLAQEGETPT